MFFFVTIASNQIVKPLFSDSRCKLGWIPPSSSFACVKNLMLFNTLKKVVIQRKFSILFYWGLPQPQKEEWVGFGQRLHFPISHSSGFFQFSAPTQPGQGRKNWMNRETFCLSGFNLLLSLECDKWQDMGCLLHGNLLLLNWKPFVVISLGCHNKTPHTGCPDI